jgi:Tol biopolymer transport system component
VLIAAPAGLALMSPALAPDGRLYFESNVRTPALPGREDSDVWVMERSASGWQNAAALGAPFASEFNEHSPTADAHGTVCFNSARPNGLGRNDIYCGMRTSTDEPRLVAVVNSPSQDAAPWLSADGTVLLFASNRSGGAGGWDIYVSRKVSGEWSEPHSLASPINTAGDETWVTLSTAGDKLLFNRVEPGATRGRVHVTAYSAPPGR